ncbi:MAG TPA: bifunctional 4-hydroxy-2-oxoglutarate aldolase/2-dehydro-3-deoxy-phosphogluconate aldolase [Crinalium sp.]|jgi:2-dehydro-3-deoxyphosphogluconate aldolase/(4S)-4-hydroxy-2-oxoglutarate aldolase
MESRFLSQDEIKTRWIAQAQQERAIAVIRTADVRVGLNLAKAVALGGMRLIEITWNSDQPALQIEMIRTSLPHCIIGAGTLLNSSHIQEAIASGAEFLFTPHVDPALIHLSLDGGVPIIPGALSPTEIVTAWQAGAASVKVFPIQAVGGASYIRSLQGPLGHIPLIPTGGVTPQNAKDFLTAGAIAIGLSGQLFPAEAIATGNWELVTQQARRLMEGLKESGVRSQESRGDE